MHAPWTMRREQIVRHEPAVKPSLNHSSKHSCSLLPMARTQAAWSAADLRAYPPPGVVLDIPIDGSSLTPPHHIMCVGPQPPPGTATFVIEAGGGSPGVSYAQLADAIAAAGRRACW